MSQGHFEGGGVIFVEFSLGWVGESLTEVKNFDLSVFCMAGPEDPTPPQKKKKILTRHEEKKIVLKARNPFFSEFEIVMKKKMSFDSKKSIFFFQLWTDM